MMAAVAAIDAGMRRGEGPGGLPRLMTFSGVGQLTALALSPQSTIRRASAARETSAPIWG
jgi:hypothetical protein